MTTPVKTYLDTSSRYFPKFSFQWPCLFFAVTTFVFLPDTTAWDCCILAFAFSLRALIFCIDVKVLKIPLQRYGFILNAQRDSGIFLRNPGLRVSKSKSNITIINRTTKFLTRKRLSVITKLRFFTTCTTKFSGLVPPNWGSYWIVRQ